MNRSSIFQTNEAHVKKQKQFDIRDTIHDIEDGGAQETHNPMSADYLDKLANNLLVHKSRDCLLTEETLKSIKDPATLFMWLTDKFDVEGENLKATYSLKDDRGNVTTNDIKIAEFFEANDGSQCAWEALPESVIGHTIAQILRKPYVTFDLLVALIPSTLGATLLLFLVLFEVLVNLWKGIPNLQGNPYLCTNHFISNKLQICAVGVFFLSIGESFGDIMLELNIVLFSKRQKRKCSAQDVEEVVEQTQNPLWSANDLVKVKTLPANFLGRILCLFLVICELSLWLAVLFVGVKYILSQDTVSNLVQAMVAIVYLNDVDNLAFKILMPEYVKEEYRDLTFEIPSYPGPKTDTDDGNSERVADKDEKKNPTSFSSLKGKGLSVKTGEANVRNGVASVSGKSGRLDNGSGAPTTDTESKVVRDPKTDLIKKSLKIFSYYGATSFIAAVAVLVVLGLHAYCC